MSLGDIFNLILYQPVFNALIFLYNYISFQDMGLAIIILTMLIRFLLYPTSKKAIVSQKKMADLQSKIKKIQEKYKKDREKQAKALLELYKKEKFNPFSGILPLFFQLPILIALYLVFWRGLTEPEQLATNLYSFIPHPGVLNLSFLGLINLVNPNIFLALIAGVSQYWQAKMLTLKQEKKKEDKIKFAEIFQKQILYFFPFFTFIILLQFPSAIAIYWITSNLFTIGQQYFLLKNGSSLKS
jgi:YidC/Oxa1 family membrane protein insertase